MPARRKSSTAAVGGLALTGVLGLQRAILANLDMILTAGQKAEAEPIVWTVGLTGVTGQVHAAGDDHTDRVAAHATFDQWARLLGAERRPERTTEDGRSLLVASRRYSQGSTEHVVVLRLELPAIGEPPK